MIRAARYTFDADGLPLVSVKFAIVNPAFTIASIDIIDPPPPAPGRMNQQPHRRPNSADRDSHYKKCAALMQRAPQFLCRPLLRKQSPARARRHRWRRKEKIHDRY